MIPSWAKVGVPVICIKRGNWYAMDPNLPFHDDGETYPVYGGRYTIRGFDVTTAGVAIWLNEIVNVPRRYANGVCERGFDLRRFRPLISKTESEDLAVFRRIADLAGVDEALRRLEGVE